MNLSQFFEHWSIVENPFRGEEARHDSIFARMGVSGAETRPVESAPMPGEVELTRQGTSSTHSDFEKILGELHRPSTSIVFGEKGAGKTAIRLQIAGRIGRHNEDFPERKVFMIPYDDLNTMLDQYVDRDGRSKKENPFDGVRLVDHMDAMVSIGVGRVLNAILPGPTEPPAANLGEYAAKRARKMPALIRRDLLLLQSVYDTNDPSGARTARLRQLLKMPGGGHSAMTVIGMWLGWMPAVALFGWLQLYSGLEGFVFNAVQIGSGVLLVLWMLLLGKALVLDRLVINRVASKVHKQCRMVPRVGSGFLGSLRRMPGSVLGSGELPTTDSDEQRYAMFARLRRVIAEFGFTGIMVVIDRVDEPTLINGDSDRMRSLIWPMLNNKFLQLEGVGLKMLLPIELRHALFKESSAFFQEARLDKQNMVERLSWTGAMLYDLCNARLAVCRPANVPPLALVDVFTEDVSRQDIVEALSAMQQPRDAFKFMYRCLNEHCASVTADDGSWRIPKHILDQVRRDEAERVSQLQRGIRPA
ncbi:MAG: hypothetical protein ACSHX5_00490 [Phycisphaerales bacterium]